jgi:hypothetical protein
VAASVLMMYDTTEPFSNTMRSSSTVAARGKRGVTGVVRNVFIHRAHNLAGLLVCKVISRPVAEIALGLPPSTSLTSAQTPPRFVSATVQALSGKSAIDNLFYHAVGGHGGSDCVVPLLENDKSTHQIVITNIVVKMEPLTQIEQNN